MFLDYAHSITTNLLELEMINHDQFSDPIASDDEWDVVMEQNHD